MAKIMTKIRVLRLLEYVYDDSETMISDMNNWQVQGNLRPNHRMTIKSVVLTPDIIQEAYDNPLVPNSGDSNG